MKAMIIGAGISGLCTAIALRKAGLEVVVYERAPQLTEVGAGISLWANALRALDTIGAGAAIRERLEPLRQSELRLREGHVVAGSFFAAKLEKALGHQPVLGMIHRAELLESLVGCLPVGTVQYGHEALDVRDCGDRVEVEFTNGNRNVADLTIGADGIHSKVRSLLLDSSPPRYSGYTCFRGVTEMPASIQPGYLAEWWGRGCRVGIATLRNHQIYWWATANAPQNIRIEDKRSWLCNRFSRWADPVLELFSTTPPDAIFQNDIIDRRPDKHWYRGRCLLIGDAAHPTTPNLGQGGCLAIEDAACLYYLFSRSLPLEEIMPEFVQLRYARAATINRDSLRLGRTGQWNGRVACWLRDAIAKQLIPILGVQEMLKHARNVDPGWAE
ncbi:FAD-dependent oxidoreductase [Aureliella helgolandensis]|uniref:FAD-dependent urate hydroxylase n=1 Tax=Aureliella helgolandensis TaxID=2527968 RepID=A0A518G7F7_9BACT|nr:FAD-dependent oxidoreductase [Aureliella helgolandensis]QDV24521.1 FAD-dependent urate hydroxylase [Aureliella helgolandensis]